MIIWRDRFQTIVLLCTALCMSLSVQTAFGQDIPDPNPRPNADGTFTWWVGNNMQFPVIQDVLDAALPGDEIVVMPGLYVEDLSVATRDLTIRPACLVQDGSAYWGEVVFWNPTEGFEDDPWCMRFDGADNTYVGRPRQFKQLSTGFQSFQLVDPGEWAPQLPPHSVQEVTERSGGVTFTFWSRDVSSVAVYVVSGAPTIQSCIIKSQNGFGCGLLVTGGVSSPAFIDCIFEDLFSTSQEVDGNPAQGITIIEDEGASVLVSFRGCTVRLSSAGVRGVILQIGGRTSWSDCRFEDLECAVGDGTYELIGGPATFTECVFTRCHSRFGTVWIDATTGLDPSRQVLFDRCDFLDNTTVDGQYGGVLHAVGATGVQPPIELSGCGIDGNNGSAGFSFFDIRTPFFPYYRIGADLHDAEVLKGSGPDLNGDGVVDGADLMILLGNWGS
jgi:hypothetical protein